MTIETELLIKEAHRGCDGKRFVYIRMRGVDEWLPVKRVTHFHSSNLLVSAVLEDETTLVVRGEEFLAVRTTTTPLG